MSTGSMSDAQVADVVVNVLARETGVSPGKIDLDRSVASVPGIDSVLLLRAVLGIEETLGISIPDEDLFEAQSVRDLIDIVTRVANEQHQNHSPT